MKYSLGGKQSIQFKTDVKGLEQIAPVKPATTPTTKPGRPGPFKKPKTTPKPKAKNKSTLPSWLKSTNLGKALTQHG